MAKQEWDTKAIGAFLDAWPTPKHSVAHGDGVRLDVADQRVEVDVFPDDDFVAVKTADMRIQWFRAQPPQVKDDGETTGVLFQNPEDGSTLSITKQGEVIFMSAAHLAVSADAYVQAAVTEEGALLGSEDAVRMIVRDVLADCGYTVLETDNGQSGLHILESGARVDLLLTDVGLPGGMNGRQVADLARQQHPNLKVLFLTGYAASVLVGRGRMEQGMEVMTKPFALDALVTKVKGMIS
jgi:CheY-like chemotaxis protein